MFLDQAHAPVYVLKQKKVASVDNLEVDAEDLGLTAEPLSIQIGGGSDQHCGRHPTVGRHPTQRLEGFHRPVPVSRAEDLGLGLRSARKLDSSVGAVAQAPPNVPGQGVGMEVVKWRP